MRKSDQHPLIVLMVDPIIHTDDHPFCSSDPTCGCHEDPELIAEVREAIKQGLITPEEATGKEALTTSALMATGTAFGGLYWETHALQHSTWASHERERGCWHQVVFWLSRAVQDLDCAIDQWQQSLRWLDLGRNDHRQQDPESLETIRTLMAQVQWHQSRRRALHQQVLSEYILARQHEQQQWEQQGREYKTKPPTEADAKEV